MEIPAECKEEPGEQQPAEPLSPVPADKTVLDHRRRTRRPDCHRQGAGRGRTGVDRGRERRGRNSSGSSASPRRDHSRHHHAASGRLVGAARAEERSGAVRDSGDPRDDTCGPRTRPVARRGRISDQADRHREADPNDRGLRRRQPRCAHHRRRPGLARFPPAYSDQEELAGPRGKRRRARPRTDEAAVAPPGPARPADAGNGRLRDPERDAAGSGTAEHSRGRGHLEGSFGERTQLAARPGGRRRDQGRKQQVPIGGSPRAPDLGTGRGRRRHRPC